MIGGYEVSIDKAGDYKVGCKTFTWGQVQSLKGIMVIGGFKKVAFDNTEVTLETINKTLNP